MAIMIICCVITFAIVAPFMVPLTFRKCAKMGWTLIFTITFSHVLMWEIFARQGAIILLLGYEILILPWAPIVIDGIMSERS